MVFVFWYTFYNWMLLTTATCRSASLLQRLVDRAQTQARFSGELERLQMARDLVWGRQLNDWQIREASSFGGAGQTGAALDHEQAAVVLSLPRLRFWSTPQYAPSLSSAPICRLRAPLRPPS